MCPRARKFGAANISWLSSSFSIEDPRGGPGLNQQRLSEDRVGLGTGSQATQPYCEPSQTTCKRCPLRVFGALTRGPKRGLIFPILGCPPPSVLSHE